MYHQQKTKGRNNCRKNNGGEACVFLCELLAMSKEGSMMKKRRTAPSSAFPIEKKRDLTDQYQKIESNE